MWGRGVGGAEKEKKEMKWSQKNKYNSHKAVDGYFLLYDCYCILLFGAGIQTTLHFRLCLSWCLSARISTPPPLRLSTSPLGRFLFFPSKRDVAQIHRFFLTAFVAPQIDKFGASEEGGGVVGWWWGGVVGCRGLRHQQIGTGGGGGGRSNDTKKSVKRSL